jgi:hypothetical protein
MRSTRFETRRVFLPGLQILTGILTGLSSTFEWSLWWLFAVPWAVLNFPGLILAIPVITVAYLVAGVSRFDWRSETFFVGWFIAAPTVLSVIACQLWIFWHRKRASRLRPGIAAGLRGSVS